MCAHTKGMYGQAQMEWNGLTQTPALGKKGDAPLFLGGKKYQIAHLTFRFEATRMKLSLQKFKADCFLGKKILSIEFNSKGGKKEI